MDDRSPSMLKPTLIGGAAAGFASGVPLVGMLNCACCSLVMGGGFLAAFLYSKECKREGVEFRPGSGAIVGLVAGLFYALASVITSGLVNLVTGQSIEQMIEQAEAMGTEIPPEAEPVIEFLMESGPFLLLVMSFFVSLLIAAVFSTIGGLIGGAVFKVEPPAAPPSPGMSAPPAPDNPAPPPPAGGGESGGTSGT